MNNMDDQDEFTPEEIEFLDASVAETERGYTLEYLMSRPVVLGRGHPLQLGEEPAQRVQFRLPPVQLARLDELAARGGETRSDVIRRAIDRELATA